MPGFLLSAITRLHLSLTLGLGRFSCALTANLFRVCQQRTVNLDALPRLQQSILRIRYLLTKNPHRAACQIKLREFSPLDWEEAKRLLSPGGGLMKVGPTSGHLMELRERLYDEVREYTDDKHLALVPDGMSLAHSETLEFTLSLAEPQDRANLLAMTPHGWRASAEKRTEVIEAAEPLLVTVSMRYDYFVLQ